MAPGGETAGSQRREGARAGDMEIMRKLIGAVAVIAALTACGSTTTVVRAPAPKSTPTRGATVKPTPAVIKTVPPKPTVTKTITQTPTPAASTPTAAPAPGYLGDIFGGGAGNPCNFASGYQVGDCNPTGETEQQYIENPGGSAPTNAQGCYYVKMGEGYCPSTGTYVPMQDPNG